MALDLSCTGTGIVLMDADGVVLRQRTVGYKLTRDARLTDKTERLVEISEAVLSVIRETQNASLPVRIERYAYGMKGAQNDLAEVHGVVRKDLHQAGVHDVDYVVVTSARAKVLGRGWGGASKPRVKAELAARGFTFENDNLMDAFVIARAYLDLPVPRLG